MDANQRYEHMAELFYKDSGFMAPGKDSPAAFGVVDRELVMKAWKEWVENLYSDLFLLHQSYSNCCENN